MTQGLNNTTGGGQERRHLIGSLPHMVWMAGPDGTVEYLNPHTIAALDIPAGGFTGRWFTLLHPDDSREAKRLWDSCVRNGTPYHAEHRVRCGDGSYRWHRSQAQPVESHDGSVGSWIGTWTEIDDLKRTGEELRQSEEELRRLFAAMTDVVLVLDSEGRYLRVAPTSPVNLYRPRDDILGKTIHEVLPREDADSVLRQIRQALRTRDTVSIEYSLLIESREVWFDGRVTPLTGDTVFWIARDITERRRAEAALKKSEEMYRTTLSKITDTVFITDDSGNFVFICPNVKFIFGYELEEVEAMDNIDQLICDVPVPDNLRELGEVQNIELEALDKHGNRHNLLLGLKSVSIDGGTTLYTMHDVTDLKKLEAENEHMTAQFHQAQKMEAIGQLAGGVAHDLNNMLTVINGYTQLLQQSEVSGEQAMERLEEVRRAGERSAALTRQLLAFGRKQVLQPSVLDLNEVVRKNEKMLRRLIGEDIAVTTVLHPHLGRVRADAAQLDQVLFNLAVNARDAMPCGGTVTFETRNSDIGDGHAVLPAGRYVALTVTDTGTGMADDVRQRLFEPFFTTKELGKGTGLGLAVVHGVITQSNGHIEVQSTPGGGSAFTIFLPFVDEAPADDERREDDEAPQSDATILLVEDEDGVRALAAFILREHGYTVLEASHGEEALRLAGRHDGPIDLLLTDVVMPGMGGARLSEELTAARQDTRVLYMSGYAGDTILRHGVRQDRVHFLQKPFLPATLARKVSDVLEA